MPSNSSAEPVHHALAGASVLRQLRWLAFVALVAVLSGCGTRAAKAPEGAADAAVDPGTAAAPHAERDPNRLPKELESLDVSGAQREQLLALKAKLHREVEPLQDAARELALAVATTARRCDGNTMALESASMGAVFAGEQARDSLLDGIDQLHQILTPAQRRTLVRRLLLRQEASREPEQTDQGARSLGAELDLSFGQLFTLLTRAQSLRTEIEERIEPWRERFETALTAFAEDRFAIRDHAAAKVPAVALATRALRDGVRTLLPILEPVQCVALADFVAGAVEDYDQKVASSRADADRVGRRTPIESDD